MLTFLLEHFGYEIRSKLFRLITKIKYDSKCEKILDDHISITSNRYTKHKHSERTHDVEQKKLRYISHTVARLFIFRRVSSERFGNAPPVSRSDRGTRHSESVSERSPMDAATFDIFKYLRIVELE